MPASDQVMARRMLANREHGYTVGHFFRSQLKKYLMTAVVHTALIGLAVSVKLYSVALFAAGLAAGSVLRDLGWFISIKRTSPFTERVIDWRKVEELANGDDPI